MTNPIASYDAGPTSTPLLDETIGANVERIASAHPDAEALVDVAGGRRWTYAELDAEIDLIARGLMAAGVERGDRVGIWAPNCPEWTVVQYATAHRQGAESRDARDQRATPEGLSRCGRRRPHHQGRPFRASTPPGEGATGVAIERPDADAWLLRTPANVVRCSAAQHGCRVE